jgi:hypothetical protein
MKPDQQFLKQTKDFWANVRTISEQAKYTDKKTGHVKVPSVSEMKGALRSVGLASTHILDERDEPVYFGQTLFAYFQHRADVVNGYIRPRLMDIERARAEFERLYARHSPSCPIPMNKQTGEKKTWAYLTGIINMLIEANGEDLPCDYDPQRLTTATRAGIPLRTLARRVDGAFPSTVNPIAVWEIKEYYYTKTFGSRVADGVYETLLDGLELEELREHEGIDVRHYLMVDDYFTWWVKGRSYLCRIVDMLHMGYLDEALFGYEVVEELPRIVKEWVSIYRNRSSSRND